MRVGSGFCDIEFGLKINQIRSCEFCSPCNLHCNPILIFSSRTEAAAETSGASAVDLIESKLKKVSLCSGLTPL